MSIQEQRGKYSTLKPPNRRTTKIWPVRVRCNKIELAGEEYKLKCCESDKEKGDRKGKGKKRRGTAKFGGRVPKAFATQLVDFKVR